MNLVINGEQREVPPLATLGELLLHLGQTTDKQPMAVAVNLDVVPADDQAEHPLQNGDRVDLVTAVGGG